MNNNYLGNRSDYFDAYVSLKSCVVDKTASIGKRKFWYIAYGSNLCLKQMAHRCPFTDVLNTKTGKLEDYELLFKGSEGFAYLNVDIREGSSVNVGLYQIDERDIRSLDRYEGFPRLYKRVVKTIRCNDGTKVKAFMYEMTAARPNCALPADWYWETCIQGFTDFGFNKRYLNEAYIKSAERAGVFEALREESIEINKEYDENDYSE